MNAGEAARVVDLSSQIRTVQQVLSLLDAGAKIIAMTLQEVVREPAPPPPGTEPQEPPGPQPEEGEEGPAPEVPEPDEPPPEPQQEAAPGAVTVSTEGLTYPPQMLDSIRQQELQMWRTAYDELAKLGATDVPPPPDGQPQAAPAQRAAAPQAARAARPSPRGRTR